MLRAEELAAIAALAGLAICTYVAAGEPASRAPAGAGAGPVPAILDTDIGGDIDDTWALSLLPKSPEVDLKLVFGDNGSALYRARLIAKMLQAAGRTGAAVGIGLRPDVNKKGSPALAGQSPPAKTPLDLPRRRPGILPAAGPPRHLRPRPVTPLATAAAGSLFSRDSASLLALLPLSPQQNPCRAKAQEGQRGRLGRNGALGARSAADRNKLGRRQRFPLAHALLGREIRLGNARAGERDRERRRLARENLVLVFGPLAALQAHVEEPQAPGPATVP